MTDTFGFGMAFYLQDKASSEMSKLQGQMKNLIGTSDSLGAAYDKGISGMKAGGAMAAAGGALLMGLGSAVSVSMDFNKAVSEVGAIANASAGDLALMKEQAIALGSATAWTAKDVANGQKYLAMAGFDANATIAAMPGLLSLASAGNLELAKASDIASDTLSMFGLKASDSNRVADVLAKTATRSNTDVIQFSEAIKYLGGTAAAMGVSLEESAAAIGILADNGLKGSVATRVISSSMLRFSKPTSQMKAEMDRLNITMFDSQGKFKGLAGMLEEVEKATAGFTDEQKLATIATLFGTDAADNILLMLNSQKEVMTENGKELMKGSKLLRGFTEEMNNAAGSADKMAAMQLDNLAGDVTQLESAFEGLAIRIGDKLEPSLRIVTKAVNTFVTNLTEFINSPFGDVVIKTAGALGVMLVAVGSVYSAVAALKMGFTVFLPLLKSGAFAASTAFLPLIGGIVAVAAALGTAWASLTEFDKVLHNMTIWETSADLKEYNTTLAKMGGFLKGVWEILQSVNGEGFTLSGETDSALNFLGEDVKNAVVSAGFWIGKVRTFFVEGFGTAMKIMQPFIDTFKELWRVAQPIFVEIGTALGSVFGSAFQTSGENMESWGTAGSMVFGILAVGLRLVLRNVQMVAQGLIWAIGFWNSYKEEIKGVVGVIWAVIKTMWAVFTLPFRLMWDIGVGIVKGLQGGFEHGWGAFKTSLLQTVYDTIALLPGGETILSTLGFERPKDYVIPQQKVMQGSQEFTGAMANSQYGLPNSAMSGLSNMQSMNASTTGQLAAKQNEQPNQAGANGGQATPFVIHNITTLDGREVARSVNEVNKEQANNSYGWD